MIIERRNYVPEAYNRLRRYITLEELEDFVKGLRAEIELAESQGRELAVEIHADKFEAWGVLSR